MNALMNASNIFVDVIETPAQVRQRIAWESFLDTCAARADWHTRTCETCFHHGSGFCSYTEEKEDMCYGQSDLDVTAHLCGYDGPVFEVAA